MSRVLCHATYRGARSALLCLGLVCVWSPCAMADEGVTPGAATPVEPTATVESQVGNLRAEPSERADTKNDSAKTDVAAGSSTSVDTTSVDTTSVDTASVDTAAVEKATTDATVARSAKEWHLDVKAALEMSKGKQVPTSGQVREMVDLYKELRVDKVLRESQRTSLKSSLRRRLVRISKMIARNEAKQKDADARIASTERAADGATPSGSLADGQAGGGAIADNGQSLVELIQETIAPDTWEVNGGLGSIMYYSPLKVLVIRQTGTVHDGVDSAMGALRKN